MRIRFETIKNNQIKVTNPDTGEPIDGILEADIELRSGGLPYAYLTVVPEFMIDIDKDDWSATVEQENSERRKLLEELLRAVALSPALMKDSNVSRLVKLLKPEVADDSVEKPKSLSEIWAKEQMDKRWDEFKEWLDNVQPEADDVSEYKMYAHPDIIKDLPDDAKQEAEQFLRAMGIESDNPIQYLAFRLSVMNDSL